MKTTQKKRDYLRHCDWETFDNINWDVLLPKLLDDIDTLKSALEQVEWVEDGGVKFCPFCNGVKSGGHASDCPRQLALQSEPNKV